MAKRKSFYAIKAIDNKEINKIVTTWEECKVITDHHAAVYKGFFTIEDALNYLENMTKEKQEEYLKCMKHAKEMKQQVKKTTKSLNVRVPNEIYSAFVDKITLFRYDKNDVIADLINDFVGME